MSATVLAAPRRYDLDWLRIAAFGLLIFYHVGMFYVTWDFHVKSSRAGEAIEPLMMLLNPWRLSLLFLISGVATRFMADKMSAWRLLGLRAWRLFPPLLFGVFVIVAPQSYFQIVEAGFHISWAEFYPHYLAGTGNWCDADGCLYTPTYNHLWFVAYLLAYTIVLCAIWPLLRRLPIRFAPPAWLLLIGPWLVLWALRATLFQAFGETHDIFNDWYAHAAYGAVFLFGFGVAKFQPFYAVCLRARWWTLALALAGYAASMAFSYLLWADREPSLMELNVARAFREAQAWFAITACIGFAHRYLRDADGPLRRYLTDAIFPFYIVHQTIIIALGHWLDPIQLPLGLEAALIIAGTALGCWASYEIARRIPPLRPLFGLRLRPRA